MAALEPETLMAAILLPHARPMPPTGSLRHKHAHVAFILMANPSDLSDVLHNDGKYAMYIPVSQPSPDHPKGAKPGENLNPVRTLRIRYDAWRKTMPSSF